MLRLLGYNGLNTDETVTRYYDNGAGLVVKSQWGRKETISPTQALTELREVWEEEHRLEVARLDPLAAPRAENIRRTIVAVEAML
jgi:hypothetical protein